MSGDSRSGASSPVRFSAPPTPVHGGLAQSRLPNTAIQGPCWPAPPPGSTVVSARQHAVSPRPGDFKADALRQGTSELIDAIGQLSVGAGPAGAGCEMALRDMSMAGWRSAPPGRSPKFVTGASPGQVAAIAPAKSHEPPPTDQGLTLIKTTDTP